MTKSLYVVQYLHREDESCSPGEGYWELRDAPPLDRKVFREMLQEGQWTRTLGNTVWQIRQFPDEPATSVRRPRVSVRRHLPSLAELKSVYEDQVYARLDRVCPPQVLKENPKLVRLIHRTSGNPMRHGVWSRMGRPWRLIRFRHLARERLQNLSD